MKNIVILRLCVLLVFLLLFSTLSNLSLALEDNGNSQVISDYSTHENSFTQFEADTSERNASLDSKDMPVEMVISRRISLRGYRLNVTVPLELVSKVLWAAYRYSWGTKSVPSLSAYPVIIYVSNETGTYKFVPESKTFILWKQGDYRGLGKGGGWHFSAPIQLYIILDTNISGTSKSNVLWGNAEAGCAIQNIYLMASTLGLGTVCTSPNRTDIRQGLSLPLNEKALYKMPLGYPLPPYTDYQNLVPTIRPSSPELPEIQDSNASLEQGLDSVLSSRDWNNNPVTLQELSQILWASYGYSYYEDTAASPWERHRTVPSAHGYYPMKIYAADSFGVYAYLPQQHTLTTIVAEDRRSSIAQASGNVWASSASLIITVAYFNDSSTEYDIGGDETYVEVGAITQNVYLESAVWGLVAAWAKANTNEEAVRTALGLTGQTLLHPTSIITVGHPLLPADLNKDGAVNIVDIAQIALAFDSRPWEPRWNGIVDLNRDGVINILDISLAAKDFR